MSAGSRVRVLVVEDQMLIAMQIEDVLRESGCEVIGPAGTLDSAVSLMREQQPDAAVLDLNLDGEKTFTLAEELQTRGIPFVVVTGYSEGAVPKRWRGQPRLTKPFRRRELEALIRGVLHQAELHSSGRGP